jgi:hypothetical protein
MALNLLNTVQSRFNDATIAAIGGQLGLDPATAKSGSAVLIPVILSAMARSGAKRSGIDDLYDTIFTGFYDGSLIDRLPAMLTSGKADEISGQGSVLIDRLLGSDADAITALVSHNLGFKVSALRSLWKMLAPMVVDSIAGEVISQKWGQQEFRNRLVSSQVELAKAMPQEIADILDLPSHSVKNEAIRTQSPPKSFGFGYSVIVAFIVSAITVFALAQYFFNPTRVDEAGQPAPPDADDSGDLPFALP